MVMIVNKQIVISFVIKYIINTRLENKISGIIFNKITLPNEKSAVIKKNNGGCAISLPP